MKKLISLISVWFMAIPYIFGLELYVGSYNIRYHNQEDDNNGDLWSKRCQVICDQINFEHPDIFGAQEVLHHQLGDMLKRLDGYGYIGVGRDDGKEEGEYAAIFYDKANIALDKSGHFWLSETPDHPGLGWDAACIRICTWDRFRDLRTDSTFYFFNLHTDHVGVTARREAAKLVVDRIRQIAGDSPVILTGDFNVDQHDETYAIFTDSGILKDSYENARLRFAENGTFNSFDPDLRTDSRIDHVFVSPWLSVDRYGILTNGYWTPVVSDAMKGSDAPQQIDFHKAKRRLPSDHYPVMVRLK